MKLACWLSVKFVVNNVTLLRFASVDHHVTAGKSSAGDASSVAPGSSGSPDGCATVPDHGVDVQWQNPSRAHQQAQG